MRWLRRKKRIPLIGLHDQIRLKGFESVGPITLVCIGYEMRDNKVVAEFKSEPFVA